MTNTIIKKVSRGGERERFSGASSRESCCGEAQVDTHPDHHTLEGPSSREILVRVVDWYVIKV